MYENYSRFITATDTIRARKADLEGLGPAVVKLQGLMGESRKEREREGGLVGALSLSLSLFNL